jgi:hypothetical protein
MLGVFVVVAASATGLVMYLNQPEEAPPPVADVAPIGAGEVITPENVERIASEVQADVDRGMFMTHFNNLWSFPDGESPSSDAIMGNHSANTYPFWCSVTLNDTGEEVYRSGLVPLGTEIAEIKLTKDLEPGSYPATIAINLVENDGVTPIRSNMGFSVTLNING